MNVDVAAAEVARFRTLLADRLGWAFLEDDLPQLTRVLRGRTDRQGVTPGTYLRHLGGRDAADELSELAEELSITETYFFRHGEQFRALAAALPDRIRDRAGARQLRMLSVGCSSGEEAYTLAIVGRQVQPDPSWTVSVLGLDANPAMLRRAADGRYTSWSLRETPDDVRQRWFRARDGGFELEHDLQHSVRFRQYNVAEEDAVLWHPRQYDVIFCRNLLMYLTPEATRSLVRRMTAALAEGGYLFLGHTDTLGSRPEGLEALHTHGTFYYRRPIPDHRHGPVPVPAPTQARSPTATAPAAQPARDPGEHPRDTGRAAAFHEPALALLRAERFTEALQVAQDGMPARPEARDLLLQGVLLAQSGRIDDAEMTARRLLDADGLYADAHHLLGVCLEGGAAVEVAIGHYRLAAYLDPDFAMPKLRLGLLARRRGDDRTARTELDRALGLLGTEREERIALFGGGFGRISLVALCRAELQASGDPR